MSISICKIPRYSTFIFKAGFDGSRAMEAIKQRSVITPNKTYINGNIFMSCLVPLEIADGTGPNRKIIWRNPTPSFPSMCRPIRFQHAKETPEIMKDEMNFLQSSIAKLDKTTVSHHSFHELNMEHHVDITMLDGKTHVTLS